MGKVKKMRKAQFQLVRWLQRNSFSIIILVPILGFFLIYVYFPTLYSFYLSLFKTRLITPVNFIGFQHYLDVLKDSYFWSALKNTFFYTVGAVIGNFVFGLGLALLLDSKIAGKIFFRSIFFIPYIIPYATLVILWWWLLDPVYGLINYLLSSIGIQAIPWLSSSNWVIPSFILINIWKRVGFNAVLFIAGLQTIPEELYEAATVDGANWWCKFRYITLPLLRPITLFVISMTMIYSLQLFIEPFVMTQGGPGHASTSVVYLLYQTAFASYNMGKASAIAVILFVIISLLTFILMRHFKTKDIYE
jgi:ABC-type sugar transport system permease subunit